MTKKDKIERMLNELGFTVTGNGFTVIKGPKVKSDVIECWNVHCIAPNGHKVLIGSCHTMTELCRKGLKLVPEDNYSQIYGDYLAEPKPKGKTLAEIFGQS